MAFFRRYKLELLIGAILVLVYFATRLFHLTNLPIFTDEAIYLRWAQIARQDPNWRFISLTDGKQPLFIWLVSSFLIIFHDPLFAGRFVSTVAGFFTALGLFFLGRETFKNKWVGIIAAFLYVIYPFGLVYDRMALYDDLIGTFTVWGLYLEILLIRYIRLDLALILSFITGASVLNKSNGFFNIYLLPFSLILFDLKKKEKFTRFLKWTGLAIITTILTYAFYNVLRLSPFFHIIAQKNATFVYPLSDWLRHPLTFFFGNLTGQVSWFVTYMGIVYILLAVGAFLIDWKFLREKVLLFLWFIIPFIGLALFGKVIYPRFILFMTLSLLPLIAYSLARIYTNYLSYFRSKILQVALLIALFFYTIATDVLILTNFSSSPIPNSDITQYSTDWPSGGGIKESIAFFTAQAQKEKIYITTEGTFGLMPASYELYLIKNPNITIKGFWPVNDLALKNLIAAGRQESVYVVFYQPCPMCPVAGIAPLSWPLTPVLQIQRGTNNYLTVYKLHE